MNQYTVTAKYLTFPVCRTNKSKKVLFFEGENLVYDLDVQFTENNQESDFTACVDMTRFTGKTLRLECRELEDIPFGQQNELPCESDWIRASRPAMHMTVPNGWNNDPNGLIYHNGVYHMYYQFNPCSPIWGNMHWGHAKSRDLVQWEDLGPVLYPDEYGTIYSGSAFYDEKNVSGLGTKDNPPILFYYTAAGGGNAMSDGQPATQRLAYSLDGGYTLIKYPTVILAHIEAYNRDPKVVFVPEINRYCMVLYTDRSDFMFFYSDDLLHWEPQNTITIPGDNECPNIVSVPVENENRSMWVLFGAHGHYYVGSFESGLFTPIQEQAQTYYETANYAGQCFTNLPGGQAIRIDWYTGAQEHLPWSQAMSIPMNLSLRYKNGLYRLCHIPVEQINHLQGKTRDFSLICISPDKPFSQDLQETADGKAYDLTFSFPNDGESVISFSFYGRQMSFNMKENRAYQSNGKYCQLCLDNDSTVSVRVLFDTCSAESFCQNGLFNVSGNGYSDILDKTLKITCSKEMVLSVRIKSLAI